MVDMWMPGAVRHAVGNTDAMNGGPARAVWHITSNASDWTFANELGWFTGGGASVAPHLLWDPFTGEIAQFFPADSRSLSLENDGAVRTNRTGKYCVQIEIVFTEGETVDGKRYATVADTPCKGLDRIVAWLRSLGIPDTWPGGTPTGFARDTVSLATWTGRGGHYGHNQIPGNHHVDPGPMPNLFHLQEDDMTPEQATQLAELHNRLLPYMGWNYKGTESQDAWAVLNGVTTQIAGLTATVKTLAGHLGSDVDTATVVAAVKEAIADAVVKVQVDVTGPTGS